jgi:hypothetical protein
MLKRTSVLTRSMRGVGLAERMLCLGRCFSEHDENRLDQAMEFIRQISQAGLALLQGVVMSDRESHKLSNKERSFPPGQPASVGAKAQERDNLRNN